MAEESTSDHQKLIRRKLFIWNALALPLRSQRSSGHKSSAWVICLLTHSSTQPAHVILHGNIHKIRRGCFWWPVPSTAWSNRSWKLYKKPMNFSLSLSQHHRGWHWGWERLNNSPDPCPPTPKPGDGEEKVQTRRILWEGTSSLYRSRILNIFQIWLLNWSSPSSRLLSHNLCRSGLEHKPLQCRVILIWKCGHHP